MTKSDGMQPALPPRSRIEGWKAFLVPKTHRVAEFLVWSGATMVGNLLYGFLCLRILSVPEYAKFVVVFAIQGSLVVLMDIGITGSLVPLVGDRIDDRQLIADLVASLRQLAHWLYAIVTPLTIVVYPFLVRARHWSWQTIAFMVAVLLVSVWFARVGGAYSAVLIMRRDRRCLYRVGMITSYGTLALLLVFWALHWLNAYTAILINVAGIIYSGAAVYLRSRKLLGVTGVPSKQNRAAIIHLAVPSVPSILYFAVQGPLTILLIDFFGRTQGVASVGALGRLGSILGFFSGIYPMFVEPYFARLPVARLKRQYFGAVAAAAVFALFMIALARFFPQVFLWILGPKYAGLRFEVFLVMISSSMSMVGGIMANINGARRFVFHWDNMTRNISTLAIQILFIWKVDLSSVRNVLWFSIATLTPSLIMQTVVAFYGCARGPRRIVGLDDSLEEA
jgi:O-antigen/teichoic acid export membrane protein